jgi:hypothetical protein
MNKLIRTVLLAALCAGFGIVTDSQASEEVTYCSFYCINPNRPPISVPGSSYEDCAEKCEQYCGMPCPFLGEEIEE